MLNSRTRLPAEVTCVKHPFGLVLPTHRVAIEIVAMWHISSLTEFYPDRIAARNARELCCVQPASFK